jgi:lysozyme
MAKHEGVVVRPIQIEAVEKRMHVAYADPAHGWRVPTICSGHTRGVKRGDVATDAQCDAFFKQDVDEALWDVFRLTTVPLSQGEVDAYTDFVFNVGATKFASSTMLKKLNRNDRHGACDELLKWVNANGKPMKGLVKRRKDFHGYCVRDL